MCNWISLRRVNAALSQALRKAKLPRGEAGTVAAAAAESVQAVSDAAHGRWVKLLNARRGGSDSHLAAAVLLMQFNGKVESQICLEHCPR